MPIPEHGAEVQRIKHCQNWQGKNFHVNVVIMTNSNRGIKTNSSIVFFFIKASKAMFNAHFSS